MVIIGELVNGTRKGVGAAVEQRDGAVILDLARRQEEAGADYIDLHAGTDPDAEPEALTWLVEHVQQAVSVPLCLDSPNPAALRAALPRCERPPIINSVTAESGRYDAVAPLAVEFDAPVVALCMDDRGVPTTAEQRVEVAHALGERLVADGVPAERIYFDPVVQSIATDPHAAAAVIAAIRGIRREVPGTHIVLGMSNVSFGLPLRKAVNRAFMVQAVSAGADTLILDPTDAPLMAQLRAAEALLGQDEFCIRYIQRFREGKLTV